MPFYNLEMCRLCMSQENVNINIFTENLAESINTLLPTTVSENDILPNFICTSCKFKVITFIEYRKVVYEADLYFQKYLNRELNSLDLENTEKSTTEYVLHNLSKIEGLFIKKVTKCDDKYDQEEQNVDLQPLSLVEETIDATNSTTYKNVLFFPENNVSDFLDESDISLNKLINKSGPNSELKNNIMKGKRKIDKDKGKIKATAIYICMYCKITFPCFEDLKVHSSTSDLCKKAKLTCKTCGKVLISKKSMYQHSLSHKEKETYICDDCGKVYTNVFSLNNHKAIMHGNNEELFGNIYKCRICSTIFNNKKDLFLHIDSHSKSNVHLCDVCGKCFTTQDNLRSHLRVHSKIKSYVCEICAKQFRTKLKLIQHSYRHSGKKLLDCDMCKKKFIKKTSLKIHMQKHNSDKINC